jgi:hypothetical protein
VCLLHLVPIQVTQTLCQVQMQYDVVRCGLVSDLPVIEFLRIKRCVTGSRCGEGRPAHEEGV